MFYKGFIKVVGGIYIGGVLLLLVSACSPSNGDSTTNDQAPEWKRSLLAISSGRVADKRNLHPLIRRASGDFILSVFKKLPEKEKVKVAGIILALNEPYMISELQLLVKRFKNPRILESAEWKRIWDAYMNDQEPPSTVDGRLHTLPGAPGHYIEPDRDEIIQLNRKWDEFKRGKISAKQLAKWASKQNPNVKYKLITKIKQRNLKALLPVLEVLSFDNDELIARESLISVGLTGGDDGLRFLAGFIADERVPEDRRVFAAEVVIGIVKNARRLIKERGAEPVGNIKDKD